MPFNIRGQIWGWRGPFNEGPAIKDAKKRYARSAQLVQHEVSDETPCCLHSAFVAFGAQCVLCASVHVMLDQCIDKCELKSGHVSLESRWAEAMDMINSVIQQRHTSNSGLSPKSSLPARPTTRPRPAKNSTVTCLLRHS